LHKILTLGFSKLVYFLVKYPSPFLMEREKLSLIHKPNPSPFTMEKGFNL